MRRILASTALLLTALLSGCASSGTGTLDVQATDAPDNLGDFANLMITVSSIDVQGSGGAHSYNPSHPTFDLTKLKDGNTTSLFRDQVAVGNYSKMEFKISSAVGILNSNGTQVDVKVPSGTMFVNQHFAVSEGSTTTFVFDIHVVRQGNGGYSLQPNASGSKVK